MHTEQIFLHLNSHIRMPCLYNNLINLVRLPNWQEGENHSLKCKCNWDEIWNTFITVIELQSTVVTTPLLNCLSDKRMRCICSPSLPASPLPPKLISLSASKLDISWLLMICGGDFPLLYRTRLPEIKVNWKHKRLLWQHTVRTANWLQTYSECLVQPRSY